MKLVEILINETYVIMREQNDKEVKSEPFLVCFSKEEATEKINGMRKSEKYTYYMRKVKNSTYS